MLWQYEGALGWKCSCKGGDLQLRNGLDPRDARLGCRQNPNPSLRLLMDGRGKHLLLGLKNQMEKHSLGIRQEVAALSSDAPVSASSCWDRVCPCNCKAG